MEGMSVETLKQIQETAVKANGAKDKVQIIELPEEPKGVYGVVLEDGTYQRTEAAAGSREVILKSIDQVPTYVETAKSDLKGKPAIYFNETFVRVIQDDGPDSLRKDCAVVGLPRTPECVLIGEVSNTFFLQKDFIRLLRVDLADCKTQEIMQLINVCKAIDFSSTKKGSASVDHGRESMGFDIQDEVISKAGDIPEEVQIDLRIYEDRALDHRYKITCIVDVDAQTGQFKLTPKPAEIRKAVEQEMAAIENILGECDCPVYFGSPWM